MLATCAGDALRDLRDRAILMLGFASGGGARSEIAGLRKERLTAEQTVPVEDGLSLPSLSIYLGRTKISGVDEDEIVYLTGRPVDALDAWLAAARIDSGASFARSIAGATFPAGHSIRRRITSSSGASRWRGSIPKNFPRMIYDPATS